MNVEYRRVGNHQGTASGEMNQGMRQAFQPKEVCAETETGLDAQSAKAVSQLPWPWADC
jgi:hypothetical protein